MLQRGADEEGLELVDLWHFVPQDERYSYVFQGNGQILDHILVSPTLLLEGVPTSTRCTSTPSSRTRRQTTTRRSLAST